MNFVFGVWKSMAGAVLAAVVSTFSITAQSVYQDGIKPVGQARLEVGEGEYIPTAENLAARQEFSDMGFGIFIHWGIYSMFGQGEWHLNSGRLLQSEYSKAARGFYPADFDACQWVSAIKDAGAKYLTITVRHHDGFSMFKTDQSPYNIVDGTPFGRDVIKELADECRRQGIALHLYYSHVDWGRDDYPQGESGRFTGKDHSKADWPHYYNFMNAQLTELLTNYGQVGAIWFDGVWDHEKDSEPFDWRLSEQYALIHSLQPGCLVGNNHHHAVNPGEDFQLFERDLPGENNSGYCANSVVSKLPLETCETMNRSWGYRATDLDYKDVATLIRLIVGAAGKGANLLLNVGPQPSGALPEAALLRLKEIGEWMRKYGETIYATTAGDFPAQSWGTSTRKGNRLFVHITNAEAPIVYVPTDRKVRSAVTFDGRKPVKFRREASGGVTLLFDNTPTGTDYIVELTTEP